MSTLRTSIIFGGTGYIGGRLASRLRQGELFDRIVLADLKPPTAALEPGIEFVHCDVRQPIATQIGDAQADWIFNFAAVHREPGHAYNEYFDTNIPGARHVSAYAERIGCQNLLFASSISVYGKKARPTDEATPTYPDSAYGISKLCAELIHEGWQQRESGRRLVIVRPGVVYGPGDPGNILRMIHALQIGTFVLPGDGQVFKSYAYIFGLIDSMEFMLSRHEPYVCYNYVERETESLQGLTRQVRSVLSIKRPPLRVPESLLVAAAHAIQLLTRGRSAVHPVRVRKAAQSTHIVPAELIRMGFEFRYDFVRSLRHWIGIAPTDFGPNDSQQAHPRRTENS